MKKERECDQKKGGKLKKLSILCIHPPTVNKQASKQGKAAIKQTDSTEDEDKIKPKFSPVSDVNNLVLPNLNLNRK